MKNTLLPVLFIRQPQGKTFQVELNRDRISIGRYPHSNDIALEPDPDHFVSRTHCLLERRAGRWWVIDAGSVNGTFVRRGLDFKQVNQPLALVDGDILCIPARKTDAGEMFYWELSFHDPQMTRPVAIRRLEATLEYDWRQFKLFRSEGGLRIEIRDLPPQEHALIRYMALRNYDKGDEFVACTYEELIHAIWGDEFAHTKDDVIHLVHMLRKRVEINPQTPQFLHLVRKFGYRLEIRSIGKPEQPLTQFSNSQE